MGAHGLYLVFGLALLLAVVLPEVLSRPAISAPIVLLLVSGAIGFLPLPRGVSTDPCRTTRSSSTSPSSPCSSRGTDPGVA